MGVVQFSGFQLVSGVVQLSPQAILEHFSPLKKTPVSISKGASTVPRPQQLPAAQPWETTDLPSVSLKFPALDI